MQALAVMLQFDGTCVTVLACTRIKPITVICMILWPL